MTEKTKIEWTDFTVNFWEGCQKVGPGCDNCYAEARDMRFTNGAHWGPGAPRRFVKGGIAKLRKINRDAVKFHKENGHWPRVFCSSLSDVFDNAVWPEWRRDAFVELETATNTRPMLLTKRVGNVFQMIPPMWANGGWPSHVGLMITVVNQAEADRDIPKLLDLKARLDIPWVGLSVEPMLGPVDLTEIRSPEIWGANPDGWTFSCFDDGDTYHLDGEPSDGPWRGVAIDWVICGGESGHNARPMHPDWARSLRDQCAAAGTPFLFKQWGEWKPLDQNDGGFWPTNALKFIRMNADGEKVDGAWPFQKISKKAAGRSLDGATHDGFPKALAE